MKTKMKIDRDKLAANIADGLDLKTDMKLFDEKQLDYGSTNISASGEIGVAVRLQDKASRMRHILLKGIRGEKGVNNEPLADTYQDVANYGMIGMLLNRDLWK